MFNTSRKNKFYRIPAVLISMTGLICAATEQDQEINLTLFSAAFMALIAKEGYALNLSSKNVCRVLATLSASAASVLNIAKLCGDMDSSQALEDNAIAMGLACMFFARDYIDEQNLQSYSAITGCFIAGLLSILAITQRAITDYMPAALFLPLFIMCIAIPNGLQAFKTDSAFTKTFAAFAILAPLAAACSALFSSDAISLPLMLSFTVLALSLSKQEKWHDDYDGFLSPRHRGMHHNRYNTFLSPESGQENLGIDDSPSSQDDKASPPKRKAFRTQYGSPFLADPSTATSPNSVPIPLVYYNTPPSDRTWSASTIDPDMASPDTSFTMDEEPNALHHVDLPPQNHKTAEHVDRGARSHLGFSLEHQLVRASSDSRSCTIS